MKKKKIDWEKVRLFVTLGVTIYTCIMAIITFTTIDTKWYMLSVWLCIAGLVLFGVLYVLEMLIDEKKGNNLTDVSEFTYKISDID